MKTGIASRRLRPTLGIVDPDATRTLPATVVASSGFDVLAHALESFTAGRTRSARARRRRSRVRSRKARTRTATSPASKRCGCWAIYLERAVHDAHDDEAREGVMYAATLAGIGFGNAGVHVPHGMAYAVAGLVREFRPPELRRRPRDGAARHVGDRLGAGGGAVHGERASPEKHRRVAQLLGAERTRNDDEIGDTLAAALARLMRATAMPNGLRALGYGDGGRPARSSPARTRSSGCSRTRRAGSEKKS